MKKSLSTGLTLTAVAFLAMSGCGAGDPYDVSLDGITRNMTPEVRTLNQRPEDVKRHTAYANNVNSRMFWEDIHRVWYTDHPSRLNPIEIISVSGKPH
ncbi:MAG: hypothetical protein ACR2GY_04755 [Phycisphaerales bacterium]